MKINFSKEPSFDKCQFLPSKPGDKLKFSYLYSNVTLMVAPAGGGLSKTILFDFKLQPEDCSDPST